MGKIYSHATEVIVWLGPINSRFRLLKRVEDEMDFQGDKFPTARGRLSQALASLQNADARFHQDDFLDHVHELASSSYWRRLWVM
jgi:hypothetical protein